MGLTKRQRYAIGLAVLGVGALMTDRLFILPGPASAMAEALPGMSLEDKDVDLDALSALAAKLSGACEAPAPSRASEASVIPDVFASLFRIAASPEAGPEAAPVTEAISSWDPPELTAVVSAGARGYAVLNGKPLALGASRDGYTLIEVGSQSATIEHEGRRFELSLRGPTNRP